MRYSGIDTVLFNAPDGKTYELKDVRPRPGRADSSNKIECLVGSSLDEIVTRPEAYGEGYEGNSYRAFEENDVEIVENDFVVGRTGEIRIPR